jgi:hypothetical protein
MGIHQNRFYRFRNLSTLPYGYDEAGWHLLARWSRYRRPHTEQRLSKRAQAYLRRPSEKASGSASRNTMTPLVSLSSPTHSVSGNDRTYGLPEATKMQVEVPQFGRRKPRPIHSSVGKRAHDGQRTPNCRAMRGRSARAFLDAIRAVSSSPYPANPKTSFVASVMSGVGMKGKSLP